MPSFFKLLHWQTWLYGLAGGVIGGACGTVSAYMGMALAKGVGVEIQLPNWKAIGIMFVTSGFFNAVLFLAKSPLPMVGGGNTDFFRKPDAIATPETTKTP